ncbi:L-type lectin-domain containing protein [Alteromonas lipolytica]|uniref:Legume lectin domain-containing protein n=1 Tax=Alteromonas lipolytica TaxID=1856405 RepID=A0A1E8FHK9_9ALTE|nr:L-type lectin-domain containing protein [Alteromonas lipolytica]OFI34953.1 hypothetical protein BFC17_15420 [Alteromonas lipolytica]GGF55352.1 hypothetical protein GCM10011338_04520 [Alteromonas lipolytica]
MFKRSLTALALVVSFSSSASVISYTDFSSTAGLQLNGHAQQVGNVIRLTETTSQAGSFFSTDAQTLGSDVSFSSFFSFNIFDGVGISDVDGIGADGIVFTLQTVSNQAGGGGGGIGYQNLAQSVGIEFDTWNNGGYDDNSGNHVGINVNGNMDSLALVTEATRFNDGDDWFAWVDYDGITDQLSVRYSQNVVKPTLASLEYTIDLTSIFGSNDVYAGFTSGTGGAGNKHDITSFAFSTEFDEDFAGNGINEVSAPGTLALLGLSAFGLAARARRKG